MPVSLRKKIEEREATLLAMTGTWAQLISRGDHLTDGESKHYAELWAGIQKRNRELDRLRARRADQLAERQRRVEEIRKATA